MIRSRHRQIYLVENIYQVSCLDSLANPFFIPFKGWLTQDLHKVVYRPLETSIIVASQVIFRATNGINDVTHFLFE